MKPIVAIYMIRIVLGIISGMIGGFVVQYANWNPIDTLTFINCITIALAIYLFSYYAIKSQFYNKVEKKSKIMTMGIGIFFISWIIALGLTYTIFVI